MCSLGRITVCYGIIGERARDEKVKIKGVSPKKLYSFQSFWTSKRKDGMKLVGKEYPVLSQETVQTGPTQAGYPADLLNVLSGE